MALRDFQSFLRAKTKTIYLAAIPTFSPSVDLPSLFTSLGGYTVLDRLWREWHEKNLWREELAIACCTNSLAYWNTNSHGMSPFQLWRVMYDGSPLGSPSVTRETFQKEPSLDFGIGVLKDTDIKYIFTCNQAWKDATYLCESQKEALRCVQSTASWYPSPQQGAPLFLKNG